ncbi:MAG TPA: DUF58 domain-containing protein [Gammaproteobacteria bacterium]
MSTIALPRRTLQRLRANFDAWIHRRMRPAARSQTLEPRSTYILPTRYGVFFAFVIYSMLMGSINYSNNMGFLLTFLLAGLSLVGLLYTYRNLIRLKLTVGPTKPVFAGETAVFPLYLETVGGRPAFRIGIDDEYHNPLLADVPASGTQTVLVQRTSRHRGYLPLDKIKIWSEFPLGLFRTWSWLAMKSRVLVYPRPAGTRQFPPYSTLSSGHRHTQTSGNDDFAGIRRYQTGDSPRHMAWKAAARGHELLTKQFSGLAGNEVWLDWETLTGMETEQRLSQLCQWVLDLEHQGRSYGLRLPGIMIPPSHGDAHKAACLERLALYEL